MKKLLLLITFISTNLHAVYLPGSDEALRVGQNGVCNNDDSVKEIKQRYKAFAKPSKVAADKINKAVNLFTEGAENTADEITEATCGNLSALEGDYSLLIDSVQNFGRKIGKVSPNAEDSVRDIKRSLIKEKPMKSDVFKEALSACKKDEELSSSTKLSSFLNEKGLEELSEELLDASTEVVEALSDDQNPYSIRKEALLPTAVNANKCIQVAQFKKKQKQNQWSQFGGLMGSVLMANQYGTYGSQTFGNPYGMYQNPYLGYQGCYGQGCMPSMYNYNRGFTGMPQQYGMPYGYSPQMYSGYGMSK